MELDPKNYNYGDNVGYNVAFVDGQLSFIGEDKAGNKYRVDWAAEEKGYGDESYFWMTTIWSGVSALRAGAAAVMGARGTAVAFTEHGAARAVLRGIREADVKTAIKSATQVVVKMGKYGTPQKHYIGANGITVIVEQAGRNAGKIVTVFRTGVQ